MAEVIFDCHEWMVDWDEEINKAYGLFPENITKGSRKRVFWKCHVCGGRWDTVVKERRGCPYCSGFKALSGFNDLLTTNPELGDEWDYEKNMVKPTEITAGSQKKVWWKCKEGHSWEMLVRSRTKGQNCPYCNNRRVLAGYNDLASLRPDLAKEWDQEKNGDLKPSDVIAGSKRYVWWKCSSGHGWRAQILQRNRGTGCPVCANKVASPHHNDFASQHPELLDEWDFERNELSPEEVTSGSMKPVWWICKKGHRWKTAVAYRCRGTGCPKCSEERQVSFPEKTILYYIKKKYPDFEANYRDTWTSIYELDMYWEKQKIAIEYDGVYGHSKENGIARDIRKNRICSENGVTLFRIREHGCPSTNDTSIDYILNKENDLKPAIYFLLDEIQKRCNENGKCLKTDLDIDISRDAGDIFSLIEYSEKQNSLANRAPQIASMWHPRKNGKLEPENVSIMSSKVVWWLGTCGHEWRSPIAYEVSSGLCPYCSGKRILVGFNDLQTTNSAVAGEWDYEKNAPLTPFEVTAGSGKKVWWKCNKNHSWQASIVSRNRGNGCPICANRIVQAGYNDVASVTELLEEWSVEKNKSDPQEVCIGSDKRAWWICKTCGNEWQAKICDRYRGQGCPMCAKSHRAEAVAETYVKRSGSLQTKRPDLVDEWYWNKNNDFTPSQVTCGSTKKAWWICKECGYRWKAIIASRCRKDGGGCPKCAGKIKP